MDQKVIRQFEALRPSIKLQWERLLRVEPVVSPLANPDALIFLMDETLDELVEAMGTRSLKTWLQRNPIPVPPSAELYRCSLNPLLAYFTTGDRALSAVAENQLGATFLEIQLIFHAIAHREIDLLCDACQIRGSVQCRNAASFAAAVS